MIKTQLNRFTSILTTIAVGLIASANINAADEGPESFIYAPIKALKEKNPKALWDMIPASYQNDLNQLLQTFANEMDYDLIQEDDTFNFLDLDSFSPNQQLTLEIVHSDGSKDTIKLNHTYNEGQIEWFKEGSALNLIKKENAA